MKKDFIVRRSITMVEGKPHVETYSKQELVRCKDCKYHFVDGDNVRFNMCLLNHNKVQSDDWFCADGERR